MPNKLCISLQDIILNTNPQQFSFTIVKSTHQQATTTTHILFYKSKTKQKKTVKKLYKAKRNDNASLVLPKSLQIAFRNTYIYIHTHTSMCIQAQNKLQDIFILLFPQNLHAHQLQLQLQLQCQHSKQNKSKNIQSMLRQKVCYAYRAWYEILLFSPNCESDKNVYRLGMNIHIYIWQ